jgi:endonuclease-3 related protein
MANTRETLLALYEAMRARFGPQHWWPSCPDLAPRDRKLEVCVGAILTQNTNWRNVEKALCNLIAGGVMSLQALREVPVEHLAGLIRPAGYYNVKARRVKAFIEKLTIGDSRSPTARPGGGAPSALERFLGQPLPELRQRLLAINGIGPETADSILLYAAGKRSFVVDAYTRRVLVRHGLIEPRATYDGIKSLLEANLPRRTALYNEYHALLVTVGKHHCRPTARCPGCPLDGFAHDEHAGCGKRGA